MQLRETDSRRGILRITYNITVSINPGSNERVMDKVKCEYPKYVAYVRLNLMLVVPSSTDINLRNLYRLYSIPADVVGKQSSSDRSWLIFPALGIYVARLWTNLAKGWAWIQVIESTSYGQRGGRSEGLKPKPNWD